MNLILIIQSIFNTSHPPGQAFIYFIWPRPELRTLRISGVCVHWQINVSRLLKQNDNTNRQYLQHCNSASHYIYIYDSLLQMPLELNLKIHSRSVY